MNVKAYLWLTQQYGGKEVLWIDLPEIDRLYIDTITGEMWTAGDNPIPNNIVEQATQVWETWKRNDAGALV